MAQETRHIVQPYTLRRQRGCEPVPVPGEPLVVTGGTTARERAERLYQTGRYAGVDAYSVTVDEDAGDYSEPVFHVRLGRVPDYEG